MESSGLIKNIPFVEDSNSADLYYGKFEYKVEFYFPGINRVRNIKSLRQLEDHLVYTFTRYGSATTKTIKDMIVDCGGSVEIIHKFIEWKSSTDTSPAKLVINVDKLTVYFTDFDFINNFIACVGAPVRCAYRRIRRPGFERGVIYLVAPKHKWRVFLNSNIMDKHVLGELDNVVSKYDFFPCRTLSKNISMRTSILRYRYYNHFNQFLDYDDDTLTSIFAIYFPNLIKKICKIEKK